MPDNTVARLRQHLSNRDIPVQTHWDGCIEEHPMCALAWALDEIERLRDAGDALADMVSQPCHCVEAHDGAINETCAPCAACIDWQEVRRD